ncbi:MAG TPA: hypothetical protein DIT89_11655 [Planctomycetaceae bacterium]|nr:hypothetical protein [Planctomycetaceae bacterium]
MRTFGRHLRRGVVLTTICLLLLSNSGCTLTGGFVSVLWTYMRFFKTLPAVPVPAYQSQLIEDKLHEDERYNRVPVLDPVEGDVFCVDPPSEDQVMRAMPNDPAGGFAFFQETQINNVRIVVEPLVDRLDDCKVYPLVGPARLHHCHYKCTIYYDKTVRAYWPVPFTHTDQSQEVVYIDKDHLIRCAGPAMQ